MEEAQGNRAVITVVIGEIHLMVSLQPTKTVTWRVLPFGAMAASKPDGSKNNRF
jgi:hypothetical protein